MTYLGSSFKDALLKESPIVVSLARIRPRYKKFFKEKGMICRFNGLWPKLADLLKWNTPTCKSEIKKEVFIYLCMQGFFIVKFNLAEDRFYPQLQRLVLVQSMAMLEAMGTNFLIEQETLSPLPQSRYRCLTSHYSSGDLHYCRRSKTHWENSM